MALTVEEGLRNAGNICIGLANASKPTSDGGAKITMSELFGIVTSNGIQIVKDVQDDDEVVTGSGE